MNYDVQHETTLEDIINDYVKLMNGYIKLRKPAANTPRATSLKP